VKPLFYGIVFAQSLILTLLLTPAAKWAARRLGFLDQPNHRKVHVTPTPLLGGAAIYLAFVLTILGNLLAVWLLSPYGDSQGGLVPRLLAAAAHYQSGILLRAGELAGLLLGGTVVFLVGLYDDRFGVRPLVKLVGQIAAAALFFVFFFHFSEDRAFFFLNNPLIIAFVLSVWIVGITNSINLMDNMDGLCAGVSAISIFFFILVTYQLEEQTFMILSLLALLGAVLGFLWHNFNPARIFMGDAGSMFIGFTIACLIIFSTFYTSQSQTVLAVAMPPVILAVPIFDTLSVIAIRVKRGLPIYQADKNHFSHRLVALGMTQKSAVLFIYLVTLCTGIGALLLHQVGFFGGVIVLIQVTIIMGIILLLETTGRSGSDPSST